MEEKQTSILILNQDAAKQFALAAECRIYLEKLPGQEEYRRSIEARSVADAYNGVAVLLRDMAQMMEQPLDHVVAVLATVLLAPHALQEGEQHGG